jgi:hypothetical protein
MGFYWGYEALDVLPGNQWQHAIQKNFIKHFYLKQSVVILYFTISTNLLFITEFCKIF